MLTMGVARRPCHVRRGVAAPPAMFGLRGLRWMPDRGHGSRDTQRSHVPVFAPVLASKCPTVGQP